MDFAANGFLYKENFITKRHPPESTCQVGVIYKKGGNEKPKPVGDEPFGDVHFLVLTIWGRTFFGSYPVGLESTG